MRTCIFIFFITFLNILASAQQYNVPLNHQYYNWLDKAVNNPQDTFFHTTFKPNIASHVNYEETEDSARFNWDRKKRKRWLGRKLWNESFVKVDTGNFRLRIDPLFNLQYGKDNATNPTATRTSFYTNTRGIRVQGSVTSKLSFETSFYENQAFFPTYLNNYVIGHAEEYFANNTYRPLANFGLVPGQGRAKPFKDGGFDYAMASGYVSYSPFRSFNLQAGHGKNFIGEGYRSLLLSDNAFNYPYLRATTSLLKNKIQYTNTFASLQRLRRVPASNGPEAPFEPKAATFHYLSFVPHKRFQIGLFEGIMWERYDSTGSKPLDVNYFAPVMGLNTAINGMNGSNNALIGLTAKALPLKQLKLYGQLANDNAGKWAYQAGTEIFDLFGVLPNLDLLVEYNSIASGTYSHSTQLQAYTHYGQPLAHPSGAALNEVIAVVNYNFRNLFLNLRYVMGNQAENCIESDPTGNCDYGPQVGAAQWGSYNNGYLLNAELSYLLNPSNNMQLTAGITKADLRNVNFVYVAFRTALTNRYYDF